MFFICFWFVPIFSQFGNQSSPIYSNYPCSLGIHRQRRRSLVAREGSRDSKAIRVLLYSAILLTTAESLPQPSDRWANYAAPTWAGQIRLLAGPGREPRSSVCNCDKLMPAPRSVTLDVHHRSSSVLPVILKVLKNIYSWDGFQRSLAEETLGFLSRTLVCDYVLSQIHSGWPVVGNLLWALLQGASGFWKLSLSGMGTSLLNLWIQGELGVVLCKP